MLLEHNFFCPNLLKTGNKPEITMSKLTYLVSKKLKLRLHQESPGYLFQFQTFI